MALCSLRKAVATALGACAILTFANMSSYAADKDIYSTWDGDNVAAKVQYEYKPDSMFTVYGRPGYLTDIELKKGEVPNYIGAGDTSRWMIDQADVNGIHHIYIKPLADDLETNLIVNTDERCYRFVIASDSDNYTPIVSFKFTAEDKAAEDAAYHQRLLQAMEKPLTKDERLYRDIFFEKQKNIYVRKKLNTRYEVVRHGKIADELYPVKIFDDGTRTYFQMSSSNTSQMPVLYRINDEKKPVLVNYRIKGPFFIADQLFETAQLQYSAKSYLTIRSLDIHMNHLLPGKVDYSKISSGTLHEKILELQAKKQAKDADSSDSTDTNASSDSQVHKVQKTTPTVRLRPTVEDKAKVSKDSERIFEEAIWTEHNDTHKSGHSNNSLHIQRLIKQSQSKAKAPSDNGNQMVSAQSVLNDIDDAISTDVSN